MLFNSPGFVFVFLPLTLLAYYLLGLTRVTALPVLATVIASLIFYSWDAPSRLLPLILLSILFNYCSGIALILHRSRIMLSLSVMVDLITLGYFKYLGFFSQNLAVMGLPVSATTVALPIGISFYTFTQIAFLVDAYRGKVTDRSILRYFLFVTYFPHLIAGPILHHSEMMPQFSNKSNFKLNFYNITEGLSLFALGLAKKVVVADSLSQYSDAAFGAVLHGTTIATSAAWLGALSYTLQIYFDFSGYSDMAIGLALMMNIRFPINFFSPYKASSIIEFWRRWHITLSRFLRDYLYISLGGNRKGWARRHANLFATMLLGGFWHGASWNFVLWGAIHGGALIINHAVREVGSRLHLSVPRLIGQAATLLVVICAWVPFRAADLHTTLAIWSSMAGFQSGAGPPAQDWIAASSWVAAAGALAVLAPNTIQIFRYVEDKATSGVRWRVSPVWAAACGIAFGVAIAKSLTHESAFLYFRF